MNSFWTGSVSAALWAAVCAAEAPRPNVLLLFSDQHNAEVMGCAGHAVVKTPALDALAKQGVRFTRAYSQDAICVPSRVSLMTGLYPRTTGCLYNGDEDQYNDRKDFRPLQQALGASGYFTAFAGKMHLGKRRLIQGWNRSATVLPLKAEPLQESYFDWIREKGKEAAFQRDWDGSLKSDLCAHISDLPDELRDTAYTAAKAADFIREAARQGKLFFCWASFHGPHQPYTPTRRWADLYPPERIPLPDTVSEPVENLPPDLQNWRKNVKTPWNLATAAQNPDLYRRYIASYYAQVSEVDHYLGQVLACLDALGVRENTIVIYASDHGDFVGRHGMVEKCAVGHNVYEETLRVPLIISWPGHFRQNATCDSLAELVDLYPTVAELLKIGRPAGALPLAGRSLVPALTEGKPTGRQYAFSENWSQATVIGERYKLGVWQDPGPAYARWDWRGKTRDQLFDRQSDPLETHNLIGKPDVADVEKELRDALAEWQRTTPSEGKAQVTEARQKAAIRKPVEKKAQTARPNVITLIVDDLGTGDVSCLSGGKVKTPNLDRLAKSGVAFTSGYVTAPLCGPSRAGYYTGRYQQRFGFIDNDGAIPADVPGLPGVLRAAGYRTALIGKWHGGGPLPHERGWFDETFCSPKPSPFIQYQGPTLARNGKLEKTSGYSTDTFAQEAESFIERNKAAPFALTVAFNAPHIDRVVEKFFVTRQKFDEAQAAGRVYDVPKYPTARPGEAARYAEQFPGDQARADTVATIAALDHAVGRILDKLEQAGLTRKTAIFFFADNGAHPENRSENGVLRDYKWSHYEGGIRVPFLAAYPGVFPAGLTYSEAVSTLDIFPTVAALAGITPPAPLDGVSLVPYLKGEKSGAPHESLFFSTTRHGAVRQGQWKLVLSPNGAPQLFDLARDVSEKDDLAAAEPARVQELKQKWQAWSDQMPVPVSRGKASKE